MEERVLFPRCSKAALEQAADAVDHALNQGIFRLRVQMNLEHFDLNHQTLAESSLPLLINTLAARCVHVRVRVRVNVRVRVRVRVHVHVHVCDCIHYSIIL